MDTANTLTLLGIVLGPLYGFIVVVAVPYAVFLWKKTTRIDDKQDNLEERIEENHDHITDIKGTHNPKDGCNQCKPAWRHSHDLPPFRSLTQSETDERHA